MHGKTTFFNKILVFLSVIFCGIVDAQELRQQLYNRALFPLAFKQQVLFDQITHSYLRDRTLNEDSLNSLHEFANDQENPHIPSIRLLAKKAVEEHDEESARVLTAKGVSLGDPLSMLSHATLLNSTPLNNENHEQIKNHITAHQLLSVARATVSPIIVTKNNTFIFDRTAQRNAHALFSSSIADLYALYYQEMESLATQNPTEFQEIREQAAQQAYMPAACYFMNKAFENSNDYHALKESVEWAELITARPEFYAYYGNTKPALTYLARSGSIAVLKKIAEQREYADLSNRAAMMLGELGINELTSETYEISFERIIAEHETKKFLQQAAQLNPQALIMLLSFKDEGEHKNICHTLIAALPYLSESKAEQAVLLMLKVIENMKRTDSSSAHSIASDLFSSTIFQQVQTRFDRFKLYNLAQEMLALGKKDEAKSALGLSFEKGSIRAGCRLLLEMDVDTKNTLSILDQLLQYVEKLSPTALKELSPDLQTAFEHIAINTTEPHIHEHLVARIQNYATCFKVFKELYKNGKRKDEERREMAYRYMRRCLEAENVLQKVESIGYCLRYADLHIFAIDALDSLPDALKENSEIVNLRTRLLNILLAKPHDTDLQLTSHIYRLLSQLPADAQKSTDLKKEYLKKAALLGNESALRDALSDESFNVVQVNEQGFLKTARFYSEAIDTCARLNYADLKEKYLSKLQHLFTLSFPYIEKNTIANAPFLFKDPEIFYLFSRGLAELPNSAALAFDIAERIALQKNVLTRITEVGYDSFLKTAMIQGYGWAYYAQAVSSMHRLIDENAFPHQTVSSLTTLRDDIADLIDKAENARIPYTRAKLVSSGELDFIIGGKLELLGQKNEDFSAKVAALRFYKTSAEKKFSKALYKVGTGFLEGALGKGQECAEKAIDYLVEAGKKGEGDAMNLLQNIYNEGFFYTFPCSGYITYQMREMITQVPGIVMAKTEQNEKSIQYIYLKAIECLKANDYQQAITLFTQEADKGNVGARAFLGVMARDGLIKNVSRDEMKKLWLSALENWNNNDIHHYKILHHTAITLEQLYPEDLGVQLAIAKFRVDIERFLGSLVNRGTKMLNAFAKINDLQNLIHTRKCVQDKQHYLSSGLPQSINDLCDKSDDPTPYMHAIVVNQCLIQMWKADLTDAENQLLRFPHEKFVNVLSKAILAKNNIKVALIPEELLGLIESLDDADEEINNVRGALFIAGALEKTQWGDIEKGKRILTQAWQKKNVTAGLLLANLHMYVFASFPHAFDPAIGKTILKELADVYKNNLARVELAELAIEDNNLVVAEDYVTAVISDNPKDTHANLLLSTILLRSDKAEKNCERIVQLSKNAARNKEYVESSLMIQAYCGIKYPQSFAMGDSMINEDEILHKLYSTLISCHKREKLTNNMLTSLCIYNDFLTLFKSWADSLARTTSEEKERVARAYAYVALMNTIMAHNYHTIELEKKSIDTIETAIGVLKTLKSLHLKQKPLDVEFAELIVELIVKETQKESPEKLIEKMASISRKLKAEKKKLEEYPLAELAFYGIQKLGLTAPKKLQNRIALIQQIIDTL